MPKIRTIRRTVAQSATPPHSHSGHEVWNTSHRIGHGVPPHRRTARALEYGERGTKKLNACCKCDESSSLLRQLALRSGQGVDTRETLARKGVREQEIEQG